MLELREYFNTDISWGVLAWPSTRKILPRSLWRMATSVHADDAARLQELLSTTRSMLGASKNFLEQERLDDARDHIAKSHAALIEAIKLLQSLIR